MAQDKMVNLENTWNCIAKIYGIDADNKDEVNGCLDSLTAAYDRQTLMEMVVDYRKQRRAIYPEEQLTIDLEAVKASTPLQFFRFTEVMRADQPGIPSADEVVIKDNKVYRTLIVHIHHIEDRGDFYYVGYTPLNKRFGQFGYTRIYKDTTGRQWGTLGVAKTNVDGFER